MRTFTYLQVWVSARISAKLKIQGDFGRIFIGPWLVLLPDELSKQDTQLASIKPFYLFVSEEVSWIQMEMTIFPDRPAADIKVDDMGWFFLLRPSCVTPQPVISSFQLTNAPVFDSFSLDSS